MRALRAAALAVLLLIVGAGSVIGYYAYRVSRQPIALPWLRAYVESAARESQPGLAPSIGGIELAWEPTRRQLELRALDVHVRDAESGQELILPAIAVHPRLRALLHGELKLRHLTFIGPRLAVVRTADGITLHRGTPPADDQTTSQALTTSAFLRTLHQLLAAVGFIEIRDGEITVEDQPLAHTWALRAMNAELSAAAGRIHARAQARVQSGDLDVTVWLTGTEADPTRADIGVGLADIIPAAILRATPDASRFKLPPALEDVLSALKSPITAEARFALGTPAQLDGPIQIAIRGDKLAIEDATRGLRLRDGKLQVDLEVDAGVESARISKATLAFPETTLTADASLTRVGKDVRLLLHAAVNRFPAAALRKYWPPSAAPKAREWVTENIPNGVASDVRTTLDLQLGTARGNQRFELTGAFDGVSVRFAPEMPAATAVGGTVVVKGPDAVFTVARGRLDELVITDGTVRIAPGSDGEPRVDVDVNTRGPLARAVAVLDHEPVRLAQAIKIAPDEIDGSLVANVRCTIPIGDKEKSEPSFAGTGHIEGASLKRQINGWSITAGNFNIRLADLTVEADGRAELATVPTSFSLQQYLQRSVPATVRLQAVLDERARGALGFNLGDVIDGAIPLTATITPAQRGPWTIDLAADLVDVRFSPAITGFGKAPGQAGRALARLHVSDEQTVRIERFDIAAGGTVAQGSAEHTAVGWQMLDAQVRIPKTQKSGMSTVNVSARREGGSYAIALRSADAGALVDQLLQGDARGGTLVLDGTLQPHQNDSSFKGHLEIDDLRFIEAPLLARLLTLGSLTGLRNAVSNKGLHFTKMTTELSYAGGVVQLQDGKADGDAMRILASGSLDTNARKMDVAASVIPSYYGLNTAPQKIPVLGPLVAKATGDAMQVIDGRVHGSFSDPQVSIAASSLVAPEIVKEQIRSWRGKEGKRKDDGG